MRPRHWRQVGSALGLEDFEPSDDFTLTKLLELNPASQEELITKVSEAAAKEFNIEQTLDNMLADWTGLELQIFPYRDTGTGVLKGVDEIQAILDEHVTMTQARSRRFVEVPSRRRRASGPPRRVRESAFMKTSPRRRRRGPSPRRPCSSRPSRGRSRSGSRRGTTSSLLLARSWTSGSRRARGVSLSSLSLWKASGPSSRDVVIPRASTDRVRRETLRAGRGQRVHEETTERNRR